MIDNIIADAIREKRCELIAQPLARIYKELAKAVLEAIDEAGFEIVDKCVDE